MIRAHVFIAGDVIGVGSRAWIVEQSKELNLTGWVRNIYPKVEAVFEGEKTDVEEMVHRCHDGPSAGFVEQVETSWEKATGEFADFRILTSE